MKFCSRGLFLALAMALPTGIVAGQESSISPEEIRALRQRIDELEQKVKTLEAGRQESSTATNNNQRIQALDQQVRELQQQQEEDRAAAAKRAKESPVISIGENGFSFSSANKDFSVQLKSLLQIDSRTFFGDSGISGNDGFILRRARPILSGTVFRNFDFFFAPDFGGTLAPFIADAYINYRFRPELQLQAGRFKVPIGMELLQSDRDTYFNERGFPSLLVPSRDMGVKLHGDVFGGVLRYDLGIFNGVGDERSTSNADFDDNKAFVGRVFVLPFKANTNSVVKNLGVGLSGSWEDMGRTNLIGLPATTGGSTAGYTTPALEQFFAYNPVGASVVAEGTHWRLSPQAYWYYGPLGITTEYVISDQQVLRLGPNSRSASLRHSAWQFSIGYVLTGEDVTFTGVVPRRAFNPLQGQWGAWQIVARYSELDLDDDAFPSFSNAATSARGAQEFALGVNWFLNRNIRLNTSFAHIHFFGAGAPGAQAPAAVSQNDENVLFTRFQLAF